MRIYNEATGDLCGCFNLSQPDDNLPDINSPSNMVISSKDDRIYLASSVRSNNKEDDLAAKVYCLSFQKEQRNGGGYILHIVPDRVITIEWPAPDQNILGSFAGLLEPERYVSVITSMAEAPDGRLCVVGFTAPRFKEEPWYTAPRFFTRPMLAIIEPDAGTSDIYTLSDVDLPLSVVWR